MLDTSCCSAAVLPKAASIRCTSSTQKWNTYTACARIRPRYSGSCSHRLAKIIDGRGRSGAAGVDLGRDMGHKKGGFGGRGGFGGGGGAEGGRGAGRAADGGGGESGGWARRDTSVASSVRGRRLRA